MEGIWSLSKAADVTPSVAASAFAGNLVAVVPAHRLLSDVHLALHPARLPLHAHVQRICTPGTQEARTHQGTGISHLAHLTMQPLGWLGLRPRSIEPGKIWGNLGFPINA